ncbi:hypothetical protein [Noviherbaspirillum aerium]|uniref:hypothetical protein n=1 Tax=Noviherbaspirillum aerium TaxID=2588497 RepID=UPI00124DFA61|nr:hypothetical protein [Noviherbaspirillum aerium]
MRLLLGKNHSKRTAEQAGLSTPGASGSSRPRKEYKAADAQASGGGVTVYSDIKCHSHVGTALDVLPAGYQKASYLYALLGHAEAAVRNEEVKSVDDFLEKFSEKAEEDKETQLKAYAKQRKDAGLKAKEAAPSAAIAVKCKEVRRIDKYLDSSERILHCLGNFKNFSEFANGKMKPATESVSPLREVTFPPLPIQNALMSDMDMDAMPSGMMGSFIAADMHLAMKDMDPYIFIDGSKGFDAMLKQMSELYAETERQPTRLKSALLEYRAHHFPLPMDHVFSEEMQRLKATKASTWVNRSDAQLRRYQLFLPLVPYSQKMSDKEFLELNSEEQVQHVLTFEKKFINHRIGNNKNISMTRSFLRRTLEGQPMQDYKKRLEMKGEASEPRLADNQVNVVIQENESSEVHSSWSVNRTRTVFDENVEPVGVVSEPLPPIFQEEAYQFKPEHNKRWPWGDVHNFGQVHPAFCEPAEPTRCAGNVVIGNVAVHDIDHLYKLYMDGLPLINISLAEKNSTAPLPKKMRKDQFEKIVKDGITDYLNAVKKHETPACYQNQKVERLREENCEPDEVAALVGDGTNPEYGVLLEQYETEKQPLAAYGRIVGIFSGIELDDEARGIYLDKLGEEIGERYLATNGIALGIAGGAGNTLATLGFGNQMRCMNTGTRKQQSGIVRSDESRCNVVFGTAQVDITDKDGVPRAMKAVFGLQIRPVEKDKQLKGYYGRGYTIDTEDTAGPSGSVQVKQEQQEQDEDGIDLL